MAVLRYWDVASGQYIALNGPPGPVGPTGPTGPTGPAGSIVSATVLTAPTVAGSPYVVNHNLNTAYPIVQIWDQTTGQMVQAQINLQSVNAIAVSVAQNMPNNVMVVVTGGTGPTPNFPSISYDQALPALTVAGSPYTISHNLNTVFPVVQMWDAVTNVQVMAQVKVVDANHVSISVTQNTPNAVNVVVLGVGQAPVPMNPGDYSTKAYVDSSTSTAQSNAQSYTDSLFARSGSVLWEKQKSAPLTGWGSTTSTTYVLVSNAALYPVNYTKYYAGTSLRVSYGCSLYQSTAATTSSFGVNLSDGAGVRNVGIFYHQAASTHATAVGSQDFTGVAAGSYTNAGLYVHCSSGQLISDAGDSCWWSIKEVWP